jgi:hypothetical protein
VEGTLHLAVDGSESQTPFHIEASKLAEVPIDWPGAKATDLNDYAITLTANVDGYDPVVKKPLLSAARFAKRTIDVNGPLDQWKGVTPVVIDSKLLSQGVDLSQYLLNPHLDQPTTDTTSQRIVARVYTAYDDANVYLAAAVNEPELKCTAGQPSIKGRGEKKVTLPYVIGMPGGLNHIANCGDSFEFAFGFRDRVPGFGRPIDDPWAWKGSFYDTDYCYVAHVSTDGDQLIRLWGADTTRQNGYQTEAVSYIEPVPGGKIKITRDEDKKLSLYQLAIPRAELKLFDPSAGRCRFSFVLHNDENVAGGAMNWGDAAGVFDHWASSGSFPPTWIQQTPCQTFFGIEK